MNERFDPMEEGWIQKQKDFEVLDPQKKEEQHEKDADEAFLLNTQNFYQKLEMENLPGGEEEKELLQLVINVAEEIKKNNGLTLVVGGFARDEVMRRFGYEVSPKDIDMEIYGIDFSKLKSIIEKFGEIDVVGESFVVIKFKHKFKDIDISIPRSDSKTGKGHKGFETTGNPEMSIKEAARRRDFTVNALALNPLTGGVVDKFGGLEDIKNKTLRATDPKTFVDDPLRVLRAMQFAGRFEFNIDPETLDLCRKLDLTELDKERVGQEWFKLLTKSRRPSLGLEAARELGVIEKLHPELQALIGTPQDKGWHPEGDVWIHTGMVLDAAAEIARKNNLDEDNTLTLVMAGLCHDLGKPSTTTKREKDGRIISHGHSEAGIEPTISFLNSLKASRQLTAEVIKLVKEHLFPSLNKDASDSAVRRLATRLSPATIEKLAMVAEADHRGRALPWHGFPEGETLLEKAKKLSVQNSKPPKLVYGRDLISIGVEPGPKMGKIIDALFDAQLDGKFSTVEEGVEYFKKRLNKKAQW